MSKDEDFKEKIKEYQKEILVLAKGTKEEKELKEYYEKISF